MTTVVISYNPISGFDSGWHGGGRLFVCASDEGRGAGIGVGSDNRRRAESVMRSLFGHYHVPVKDVQQYVLYAGFHAFDGVIALAKELEHIAPGVPIVVAACDCHWEKKVDLLRGTGIRMILCECGGSGTLGKIAQESLEEEDVLAANR